MLPLKKNPIMHKTLALYCSLWFLKKIWFLLPYIHPISNLELRLRGNKSFAAGEGRDPWTKLTPLHRQEGATCYFELPALIVTTMHLRNLTEEVSGQGQWHHMHCPRCNVPIYPHSLISLGNTPGICERVLTLCWICACLYLPIDLLCAVKAVICPLQKQLDIPESLLYTKCLNWHVTIKVCDMEKCFITEQQWKCW